MSTLLASALTWPVASTASSTSSAAAVSRRLCHHTRSQYHHHQYHHAAARTAGSAVTRIHGRSSLSTTTTATTSNGGTFKTEGNRHIYHERKILPYTQRQLYALVADVDAYQRFMPFVSSSKTVKHTGPRQDVEKPWLDDLGPAGETHELDHLMSISVMGFEEAWNSKVTCEKYSAVSARSDPSSLFKHLSTTWTLLPAPSNAPHPSQSAPSPSESLSSPGRPNEGTTPGQEKQDSPTLVSIDLAYEFANPLYAAAASAAFQRVSYKIMGSFEKRVRAIYGEGLQ